MSGGTVLGEFCIKWRDERLESEGILRAIAGFESPRKVADVRINEEARQVHIRVECARGEVWEDPETGERAGIKVWEERSLRHLDTCQFETGITAKVPRLLLTSGRTLTASEPCAALRGRFTAAFEAQVIALLLQTRTVREAARLARLTEDAVDSVMRHAVERGMQRCRLQPPTLLGSDEPEQSADRPPQASPLKIILGFLILLLSVPFAQGSDRLFAFLRNNHPGSKRLVPGKESTELPDVEISGRRFSAYCNSDPDNAVRSAGLYLRLSGTEIDPTDLQKDFDGILKALTSVNGEAGAMAIPNFQDATERTGVLHAWRSDAAILTLKKMESPGTSGIIIQHSNLDYFLSNLGADTGNYLLPGLDAHAGVLRVSSSAGLSVGDGNDKSTDAQESPIKPTLHPDSVPASQSDRDGNPVRNPSDNPAIRPLRQGGIPALPVGGSDDKSDPALPQSTSGLEALRPAPQLAERSLDERPPLRGLFSPASSYKWDPKQEAEHVKSLPFKLLGGGSESARIVDVDENVLFAGTSEGGVGGLHVSLGKKRFVVLLGDGRSRVFEPQSGLMIDLPSSPSVPNMLGFSGWKWLSDDLLITTSGVMALDKEGKPISDCGGHELSSTQLFAFRISTRALTRVSKPESVTASVFRIDQVSSDGHIQFVMDGTDPVPGGRVSWFRFHAQ